MPQEIQNVGVGNIKNKASRRVYKDPYPDSKHDPHTCEPTEAETMVLEKFDPLSSDDIEKMAGIITRAAVNVNRYNRSATHDPEHYRRLKSSAQTYAKKMFQLAVEANSEVASEVVETLETIAWDNLSDTTLPAVFFEQVPYSGSETVARLQFIEPIVETRVNLPA